MSFLRALTASGGGGGQYHTGTIIPVESTYRLANCGFAPKQVVLYRTINSSNAVVLHIDFENNKTYVTSTNGQWYNQEVDASTDQTLSAWIGCVRINGNDFEMMSPNANNSVTWNYLAVR